MARNVANIVRRRRALWLGLAGLLSVLVAAIMRRDSPEQRPAATMSAQQPLVSLATPQQPSEEAAPPTPTATHRATMDDVRKERARRLEERWDREAHEPDWSAATREGIVDALGKDLPAEDIVRAVDCRATLCRIELTFETHESVMKLGPLLAASAGSIEAHSLPDQGSADAGVLAPSDRPQYLVYAARPGVRIADLASME